VSPLAKRKALFLGEGEKKVKTRKKERERKVSLGEGKRPRKGDPKDACAIFGTTISISRVGIRTSPFTHSLFGREEVLLLTHHTEYSPKRNSKPNAIVMRPTLLLSAQRCIASSNIASARSARPRKHRSAARFSAPRAANSSDELSNLPLIDIQFEGFNSPDIPSTPGIYAIYNDKKELQYIGLSRKISASIKMHCFELPAECGFAKVLPMEEATKVDLQDGWKRWVMSHVTESGGSLPPGNTPKNELWADRKKRGPSKPSLRLTNGMTPDMSFDALKPKIQEAIDAHKIVAFIKGTREEPECGYSHRVVNALNSLLVDFETVNVLDDKYNPNLLYVMKEFSDWPTIPQVYANKEFLGGHDIIVKMFEKGELKDAIK
jgi:Grx4 family monothiol glutaredoxin